MTSSRSKHGSETRVMNIYVGLPNLHRQEPYWIPKYYDTIIYKLAEDELYSVRKKEIRALRGA